MDWITGEKFIELADFTYSPEKKRPDDYDNIPNTFDLGRINDGHIVYTHTFYVEQLYEVIKGLNKKIKLISHNSDENMRFYPPECISMHFAQNVGIIHNRVASIPIGLENDRWFKDIHKKEKMLLKLKEPRSYKNLVYINHNVATNPAKRLKPYQVLLNKPWVTMERRTNGNGFDEYLDNIYNHKFVICPEGNGIDTHRIWECLYMGTIPIVERNINNRFYMSLPIVPVSDWEEVTESFLNREFDEISDIKRYFDGDKKLLTFAYWKEKIENYD
jgi:hypothetical protein